MTIAQQLEQKGIEKDIQPGSQEGRSWLGISIACRSLPDHEHSTRASTILSSTLTKWAVFILFAFFYSPPLFPVRQKAAVAHHLKVLRRDMTDIAPDHLFLRQHLLPVLLRPVVVIVMHHGTAAVVPQLRCRHGWSLQVPTAIFGAPPGSVGFLRKVDLPATSVLRLQIALPLFFYRGYAPAPADCRDLSGYSCGAAGG